MAPKGRTPVRRVEGRGRRELAEGGIWRGIWWVLVGDSMGYSECEPEGSTRGAGTLTGSLNPIQDPAMERGTEMMNQIRTMTSIVVNGTAPDEPLAHTKRFRRKNVANTIPGISDGVRTIFIFHLSPPNVL